MPNDEDPQISEVEPTPRGGIELSYFEVQNWIEKNTHSIDFAGLIELMIELRILHASRVHPIDKIDHHIKLQLRQFRLDLIDLKIQITPFVRDFITELAELGYSQEIIEEALDRTLSLFGRCFNGIPFDDIASEIEQLIRLMGWSREKLATELENKGLQIGNDSDALGRIFLNRKVALQASYTMLSRLQCQVQRSSEIKKLPIDEDHYLDAMATYANSMDRNKQAFPDLIKLESVRLLFLFPEYSARILPWILSLGTPDVFRTMLPVIEDERKSIEARWNNGEHYLAFDDVYGEIESLLSDIIEIEEGLKGKPNGEDEVAGHVVDPLATTNDAKENNFSFRKYIVDHKSVLYLNGLFGYLMKTRLPLFNIHRHEVFDGFFGVSRIDTLEDTLNILRTALVSAMKRETSTGYLKASLATHLANRLANRRDGEEEVEIKTEEQFNRAVARMRSKKLKMYSRLDITKLQIRDWRLWKRRPIVPLGEVIQGLVEDERRADLQFGARG